MTLNDVFSILNGIVGFEDKVAYDEFPESQNQTLPYINMQTPTSYSFGADNITYYSHPNIDVELYTKRKDITLEALIEKTFTDNGIYYSKNESRIDSQSCYQVVYSIGA